MSQFVMSMKLDGDASGLRSAAQQGRAAVEGLGQSANEASGDVAVYNRALEEAAAASHKLAQEARDYQWSGGMRPASNQNVAPEQLLGIQSGRSSGQAGEDVERYGAALDELRAKYVPLFAVQQSYEASLRDIDRALAVGAISVDEHSAALQRQGVAYDAQLAMVGAGGAEASKGVALAGQQMQMLSFQANDLATMLLMGASPFQIIASQGGQVYQALSMGPGGVAGSLGEIGTMLMGLITPARLVTAGLLAAGGAAAYFVGRSADGMAEAEAALNSYENALKRVENSHGELASAAERVFERYMQGSDELNEARLRAAIAEQQRAAEALAEDFLGEQQPLSGDFALGTIGNPANWLSSVQDILRMRDSDYRALREELYGMALALDRGETTAAELQERLALISDQSDLPDGIREFVDELLTASETAREVEGRIKALTEAREELRWQRSRDRFTGAYDELDDFVPDRRAPREMLDATYDQGIYDARSYSEILGLTEAHADAVEELARQEEVRRRGFELDIRLIDAFSAEERAAIAAERERLALSGEAISATEKERRVEEARQLSLAQSAFGERESARQRRLSAERSLDAARMEANFIGQSAGEVAELQLKYQLLEQAKADAYAEGRSVSEEELAYIRAVSGALQDQVDILERRRLAWDIGQDRLSLFRSDLDNEIAGRLEGTGLDLSSPEAAYMRRTAQLDEWRQTNREVWQDIGSDIFENGVKPLEAVGNALERLSGKLTDKLTDRFADGLFNTFFGDERPLMVASPSIQFDPTSAMASAARQPMQIETGGSVSEQVWRFFTGKGLEPHQVAGIMGNVSGESGFNPLAVGDGGDAFGLFQHNDRRHALFDFIGGRGKLGDVQGQLEFAWHELMTTESRAFDALMSAGDVREATAAFGGFERPSGFSWGNPEGMHNWSGRLDGAQEALQEFGATAAGATTDLHGFGTGLGNLGQALSAGGGGGGGGPLSFLSGLFGGGGSQWSIASNGGIGLYADGGISDRPAIFGEGPYAEAAVPLPNGRSIPVDLRVAPLMGEASAGASGHAVTPVINEISVHNYSSASVRTEEESDGRGGRRTSFIIEDEVAKAATRPGSSAKKAIGSTFGLRQRLALR